MLLTDWHVWLVKMLHLTDFEKGWKIHWSNNSCIIIDFFQKSYDEPQLHRVCFFITEKDIHPWQQLEESSGHS